MYEVCFLDTPSVLIGLRGVQGAQLQPLKFFQSMTECQALIYWSTSEVPVEHEVGTGRDVTGRDDGRRTTDAGRTDVKVEIFM